MSTGGMRDSSKIDGGMRDGKSHNTGAMVVRGKLRLRQIESRQTL